MKKKIFASVLAVIMMMSIAVPSFAADNDGEAPAEAVVLGAADVTVPAGSDTADVVVSVSNVPEIGLSSVLFNVTVDGASIASVDPAATLPETGYAIVGPTDNAASEGVKVMIVDITTGISGDLAVVHVTLSPDADCGTEYAVSVTVSEDPQDFTALDGETDVAATGSGAKIIVGHAITHVDAKDATPEEAGNIEYWKCEKCGKCFSDEAGENEIAPESVIVEYVAPYTLGDANGDGKLNNRDVILVMKAVLAETAGAAMPSGLIKEAADMNGDGKLNNRDVIAVMKAVLAASAK